MKIYVASSWRNQYQEGVVKTLRDNGHEVYDFKNPLPGNHGFHWSSIDRDWINWTPEQYTNAINTPIAEDGFRLDFDAMKWADICVIVLPCGRSAHTEAGWMKGAGKTTFILIPEKQEPELMYKIFDGIFIDIQSLIGEINKITESKPKLRESLTEDPTGDSDMNYSDADPGL